MDLDNKRLLACLGYLWIIALILSAIGFNDLAAQSKEIVSAVEIKGLVTVTEEVIKTKLKTQVGKPLSSYYLRDDIQSLHQLGLFSNIEVQISETMTGVTVTFLVRENRLLGEIRFYGNKNISKETILENLRITKEKYLAPYALSLDTIKLKDLYKKKGYQFVEVNTKTQPASGWVDVYFFINEGPRVSISEINFFGNKTFSKSTLLDFTQTQEESLFSSSHYNQDVFEEDLILMRNFYRSEGFLDVRIYLRDIFYSNDRTEMVLNISVNEGPLYHVKQVTFAGNKLFSNVELHNRLKLTATKPFKQTEMLADKRKIERVYGENGYLNIQIKPVVTLPALDKYIVDIDYKIIEGRKTYIRKIDIKGNVLTRDDVIRRDMMQNPAEQFNLGKVEASQQRLRRLQYFETIKMDLNDTEDPAWKDLLISVEEGRTGNLRFAAGITSDLGAVGEVSLSKRNFDISKWPRSFSEFFSGESFTGAGQNLDIYLQIGEQLVRFKISFVEPYIFGYDYFLGVDIYRTLRTRESWDEGRIGAQLSLGKRLGRDTIIKLVYRLEQVEIDDLEDDAPLDVFAVEGNSVLSTLMLDFTIDTRDDFILATRGYIVGLSYEISGTFLGSDYDFSKVNLRLATFHTLYTNESGYKHVLSLGTRVGIAEAHSGDVPIFERFFAGGASSLRGFEFRTVGPRETAPGRADDPIGGNFMVLGTVEYSFPIYKDVLRMVVFTDIGSITPSVSSKIFSTMRIAVGVGFRIKVPLLGPRPFAFDFGFPIRKEDNDDVQVFSFSFGKPF